MDRLLLCSLVLLFAACGGEDTSTPASSDVPVLPDVAPVDVSSDGETTLDLAPDLVKRRRGLFVVVGDKGRDQVVNLHYMLSRAAVKARPSVLWCYKKDLGLSSHRKKRMKQIR